MVIKNNINSQVVGVKRNVLTKLLTCSICNKIFNDPVTIIDCLHIFCNNCIRKKIAEEYMNRCPVCNVYLGCRPLDKLRPDHNWSSIRQKIAPSLTKRAKKDNIAERGCKEKNLSHEAEKATPVLAGRKEMSLSSLLSKTKVLVPTRRRKARGRKVSSSRESAIPIEKPNKSVEGRSDASGFAANSGKADNAVASTLPSVPVLRPTRKTRGRPRKTDVSQELNLNVPAQTTDSACNQRGKREVPVWLSLVPSVSREGVEPLPQIPHCYLMIKDACLSVSYIKKYLVQKLNLDSEDEVEISLFGAALPSNMELHCLVDERSKTISESEKLPAVVGGSAQDFVMVLSYGRPRRCN